MSEFSIEDSESLIEAAARGRAGGELGQVLNALHAPGHVSAAPPAAPVAVHGVTGRIARRTAVAASAAVLGLASVAAAATGAATLLDGEEPELAEPAIVEVEIGDESDEFGASDTRAEDAAGHDPETLVEGDGGDADGPRREIDGVDPSDGLDEEELEIACTEANNHGHYVALVAGDRVTEHDGSHGERVREAAQSDCGKDTDADDADDGEGGEDAGDSADGEDGDDGEDRPGNGHGYGHDKDKGKGHEKGKGRGHDRD